MTSTRIVSFLPSATEMACALGLGDQLVGITHECDYPSEVKGKPIVVRNVLPIEKMSQTEIDAAVTQRMRDGLSLYQVDEELLQELAPDIILTQDLCQVCAPSGNEVTQALNLLPKKPQILWLTPKSLEEIFDNLRELGQATGRVKAAEELIAAGRVRLEKVASVTRTLPQRPRVFCMEWLDPVYCSGHWMPEMVEIAGGVDSLARKGADSVRILWNDVLEWAPEILIITPCGFNLGQVVEQTPQLFNNPGWSDLPAVGNGRVYAVDANSYFARPGPRVVEGTELLAHLIHPEVFEWEGSREAFQRIEFSNADLRASPSPVFLEGRQ
ncbi:MAG TPA: cobalamin-binding protein [Blastocatellia bacterium]|jgi:iron complex transport system substrate-binding protein|nr:cobalamin-binding protein [Blastocatellia bacterium]HAF25223.1 cobalamin-binding protein [Blastocatellia bacterium]HCX29298.1 cobalamin-binding protein [Blastocatellia bacterium]